MPAAPVMSLAHAVASISTRDGLVDENDERRMLAAVKQTVATIRTNFCSYIHSTYLTE